MRENLIALLNDIKKVKPPSSKGALPEAPHAVVHDGPWRDGGSGQPGYLNEALKAMARVDRVPPVPRWPAKSACTDGASKTAGG